MWRNRLGDAFELVVEVALAKRSNGCLLDTGVWVPLLVASLGFVFPPFFLHLLYFLVFERSVRLLSHCNLAGIDRLFFIRIVAVFVYFL
jgi:hypothetical protein